MTIIRMTAAMILAALAAASAPAAQACQITRTNWGLRLIDCNLSDFLKNYDVELSVIPPNPPLRMPNLQVSDIDGTLFGSTVQLDVEVENSGTWNNTRAFDVAVIASVHDPLARPGSASVSSGPLPPVSIMGLAAGATTARIVGNVNVPNRKQDWDVCAVAVVDPPAVGGSAWGNVFESNETDNTRNRCCRVYGPTPDVSGPGPC
jgi:hypothetical protein